MLETLNWIVVPGGPGLSNVYLEEALSKACIGFKLHFYNVLGSPEMPTKTVPNIHDLVGQIYDIANNQGFDKFGLITHSFGNYIAMRLLEMDDEKVRSILMISPMPFQYHLWKKALNNIIKTIPSPVLKKIENISKKDTDGSEIFKVLYPYYACKVNSLNKRISFNAIICEKVSELVSEYDDRKLILSKNIPVCCVIGAKDPFYQDKKFLNDRTIIMSEIGHYPFLEDESYFEKTIKKASQLLCYQTNVMTKKYF